MENHFIKYLKNPKLLSEVTYEELSKLRDTYPYSHILHYLLFLKSQQSKENMEEHAKNASIFAIDRNKIFEEIKNFQAQEDDTKQPTKTSMDDLFDLSEKDDQEQNKTTPQKDSEDDSTNNTTPPTRPTRIIREQRYIPLDRAKYGLPELPKEEEEKKEAIKPTQPEPETEETNVLFIDALLKKDSGDDRIELITNKDAYKEITDSSISENVLPADEVIDANEIHTPTSADENLELEITNEVITQKELPLSEENLEKENKIQTTPIDEVTNDERTEEPSRVVEKIIVPNESMVNNSANDNSTDKEDGPKESSIESNKVIPNIPKADKFETKKSFDKWVRKRKEQEEKNDSGNSPNNEEGTEIIIENKTEQTPESIIKKEKASIEKKKKKKKKKKSKKDKMPLNAKQSLKETDNIASETLAELLVKQGKNKKAIKVYERLSLIFPEKSNYFAQLIKNLKENS